MTQPPSSPDLSAVLLSFYEALTDPDQLETLMAMLTSWWDDGDEAVITPELDFHAERATKLLGEMSSQHDAPAETGDQFQVVHFSTAAGVLTSFESDIDEQEAQRLQHWLSDAEAGTALLLRQFVDGIPELIMLSPGDAPDSFQAKRTGPQFQEVVSHFVAENFDLTHAELVLVKELLLGGTLREISERLGKSWETTRSQIKSLTNKLGVRSQGDILRVINQAATLAPQRRVTTARTTTGQLDRPDGRKLVYDIDGPPSEKTLVFLHGMIQGRHWPEKSRKEAVRRGWRIVRISRAGRGGSSLNPKEGAALLQDHVEDIIAVMDAERIETACLFGQAEGFSIGYALGLAYPERVQMVVGLEVIPPITSRQVVNGFTGKMKTFGLANLYAPKTVKYMLKLAMRRLERAEDRYSGIHPLMGVELAKYEDADGLRVDDLNFQDIMQHQAEGMWRDATFSCHNWAFAPENANYRPRAALIHAGNSLNKTEGGLDIFAQAIGAPILHLDSYFPYIAGPLGLVLDTIERSQP